MSQHKKYDLIVFGSTGFTGRLIAQYLHQQYSKNRADNNSFSWALAGRNIDKMKTIVKELNLPPNTDLILADSDNKSSLDHLAQLTKVVISAVGPYQIYGEALLEACVSTGTAYVDLCGEPGWMHQMIGKYQDAARKTGAKIVFSCGFDSIPFDLGVFYLQEHLKQNGLPPLNYVKGRVRKMQGSFSGGTAASLKATLAAAKQDPFIMQALINPYSLADSKVLIEQPKGDKPYFDESLGSWVAPFIMAAINTKNVHRSNFLMNHAYGKNFRYDEMMLTGPGEKGELMANHIAKDRSLASEDGPKPGEGPGKEERENGYYDVLFVGEAENGKTYASSVSASLDPGYGSTSKMISECAICLAKDLKLEGGFYTPAPAFGHTLIERLQTNAGLVFNIVNPKVQQTA